MIDATYPPNSANRHAGNGQARNAAADHGRREDPSGIAAPNWRKRRRGGCRHSAKVRPRQFRRVVRVGKAPSGHAPDDDLARRNRAVNVRRCREWRAAMDAPDLRGRIALALTLLL